jgi:hypothetical protein
MICTGESYKSVVKLTFAKGASLEDPARLFNSSLDGNVRRAIDIHEGEEVDAAAFKALVREAIALNSASRAKPRDLRQPQPSGAAKSPTKKKAASTSAARATPAAKPKSRAKATPRAKPKLRAKK